jgi:hypothetical protein
VSLRQRRERGTPCRTPSAPSGLVREATPGEIVSGGETPKVPSRGGPPKNKIRSAT